MRESATLRTTRSSFNLNIYASLACGFRRELRRRRSVSTDEVTRLRGKDVRGVRRSDRPSGGIERREADTTLHNQRMMASGHDVTEPHPADRVGRQPRLHPDLDTQPIQLDLFGERKVCSEGEIGRAANHASDDGVVAAGDGGC